MTAPCETALDFPCRFKVCTSELSAKPCVARSRVVSTMRPASTRPTKSGIWVSIQSTKYPLPSPEETADLASRAGARFAAVACRSFRNPASTILSITSAARRRARGKSFVGAYRDGALRSPANSAASLKVTCRADFPKYRLDAASTPKLPAPRYTRLR